MRQLMATSMRAMLHWRPSRENRGYAAVTAVLYFAL